jgi:hypothetical protein
MTIAQHIAVAAIVIFTIAAGILSAMMGRPMPEEDNQKA